MVFCPAGPGDGSLGPTSVAVAHQRARARAAVLECAGYRIASSGSPRAGNGRATKKNDIKFERDTAGKALEALSVVDAATIFHRAAVLRTRQTRLSRRSECGAASSFLGHCEG